MSDCYNLLCFIDYYFQTQAPVVYGMYVCTHHRFLSLSLLVTFPSDTQPIKVSLGSYHTLILTGTHIEVPMYICVCFFSVVTGTVYACGCNEHGQCGVAPVDSSTKQTDKV